MALTAAERDSGGSGGGGGREGLWGRGEREQETKAGWEGGEKQKDEKNKRMRGKSEQERWRLIGEENGDVGGEGATEPS